MKIGVPVVRGRGQPSAELLLNPQAAYSVGVSIMSDAISFAVMDFSTHVSRSITEPFNTSDIEGALRRIEEILHNAIADGIVEDRKLLGMGLGITGYFVGPGLGMNPPLGLDAWALIDLRARLSERFNLPVWVENDGNAAALGEEMVGHGKTCRSFAFLYFALGFGGGIIVDGKPFRGVHGNAGEFASILPEDYPSPTLERLRTVLQKEGTSFDSIAEMIAQFSIKLSGVDQWLQDAERSVGLVASAISAIVDTDAIILGGRIPRDLSALLASRVKLFNPVRRGHHRPAPEILASSLGDDAAVVGAAALPLKALFFG